MNICFILFLILTPVSNLSAVGLSAETDTIRSVQMDEYVLTASRIDSRPFQSGSSAYFLDAKTIKIFPAANIPQALSYLPGLHLWSRDGIGNDIVTGIRGFHGGGETEYIHVLIDGLPVNQLENSLVNWHLIPLNRVSNIEMLRGGSSSLYGDAAMGGVINLVTKQSSQPSTEASLMYGSFASYNAHISHSRPLGAGFIDLYFNYDKTDGFRTNSDWQSLAFGARWMFPLSQRTSLSIQSINNMLDTNDPGPIVTESIDYDRRQSLPFFHYDIRDEQNYTLVTELKSQAGDNTSTRLSLQYRHRNNTGNRTYIQPPLIIDPIDFQPVNVYDTTLFGNTKQRHLVTNELMIAGNFLYKHPLNRFKLNGGVEGSYGGFDNSVYDAFMGFQNDYQYEFYKHNDIDYRGTGHRMKTAFYINGELGVLPMISIIPGLRYDLISDSFEEKTGIESRDPSKTYHALSPKVAINWITADRPKYSGSVFVNLSRSFKAPTIYQRTDLQSLNYAMFLDVGPSYQMIIHQASPFANPDLKPQKSNNLEVGTYQNIKILDDVRLSVALSGYIMKVDDEIDFDLSTFGYRNIQNSLHQGVETSINLLYDDWLKAFFHLNCVDVKFDSGPNKGNYLKGVPRRNHQAGVGVDLNNGLSAGLTLQGNGDIFIDDENINKIDAYQVLNSRISYQFRKVRVSLDVFNVLNSYYYIYGYMIYGTEFSYPAAGRYFRMGLSFSI